MGGYKMSRTSTVYKQYLLLKQINLKKKDMYNKAKQLGFTHTLVVACSQELDQLLNKYQGIFSFKRAG